MSNWVRVFRTLRGIFMRMTLSAVLLLALVSTSSQSMAGDRYSDVVQQMHDLQNRYPKFTSIYSIGTNDEGKDILAMRISTTPNQLDPRKIGQIIVATHHGNEGGAVTFSVYFTEQLLKRYASGELYRGNLGQMEWTIIPVLNISGYNADEREEHGIDPNRDYPGVCIAKHGGSLKSIRLLMDLLKTRTFVGSVTVHGYEGSLTYPWGVDADNTHTQDHDIFDSITAKAAALNSYRYGTSTDIVYPADGAYEDFVYWKYGIWSLLLELRDGSASDVQNTTKAIASYFDSLNASPSVKNQFTAHCNNALNFALRAE